MDMSNTNNEASALIRTSTITDTIATAVYTPELAAELEALCDDSTDANDGVTEYWANDPTDENAMAWVVYLTGRIRASDIQALRHEAGEAGDLEQVAICDRALNGDQDAWAECARIIAEAHANDDE